ncbi:MAG: permease [Candidatus Dormibacteraceae bacterium]
MIGKAILDALGLSVSMLWDVLWPLTLGFLLSAVVQTVVSKRAVEKTLGRPDWRGAAIATALGAASSSCSYASVAMGRALFRRGATFANTIIFQFASTNLVFELGLILLVLLGWRFLAAEFVGGLVMVLILWMLFKLTLRPRLVERAARQADLGLVGKMEGHGTMDMSITGGSFLSRLLSGRALTAISHYFYMDVLSLWSDLGLGFLIAGALGAWVPDSFWQSFFFAHNQVANELWSPLVGPFIAMISFVCSIGNVPLAAVLWNGGIGFGGVVAFIFADLIILPILNIYRKYYGARMSVYLLVVSYATMALAGFLVSIAFQALGLAPEHHHIAIAISPPQWNYTTYLDLAGLGLAAVLGARFMTTGGPAMMRAMNAPPQAADTLRVIDPVCGMTVEPPTGHELEQGGRVLHFCSSGCRTAFMADPERYEPAAPGGSQP